MIRELEDPVLLHLFTTARHDYRRLDSQFVRGKVSESLIRYSPQHADSMRFDNLDMDVDYAFDVSGVEVDLGFSPAENRRARFNVRFPVELFARRGQEHDERWSSRLRFRDRRSVVADGFGTVNLPRAVAFPRYLPLRLDRNTDELARGKLGAWKLTQAVDGIQLPEFTYYDGERREPFIEYLPQISSEYC